MNHADPREPIFPLMGISPARSPMRAPRLSAEVTPHVSDLAVEPRVFPGAWSARWSRALQAVTGTAGGVHSPRGDH